MNRKKFMGSMLGLGAALPVSAAMHQDDRPLIIPPSLKPGDTIGVTSPAGFILLEEVAPAVRQIESWGFRVRLGKTIGHRFFTFGGSDDERVADLQQMLDDPSLSAIMCARGGYGAIRIVDRLNFSGLLNHPKWIIGFSDITVLHSHLNRNYNIASVHSKMCNSFPEVWELADDLQKATIVSIRLALTGTKIENSAIPSRYNRIGTAEGVLVGGNLKTLETLTGSSSDIFTNGKILFVEDTGEYLYSIDRMFWNLKRTGKLSGLKGLIVGGFKIRPDDAGEEFGISLQELVMSKIKEFSYPVCFDFPVGHQKNNFALKCGIRHRLTVNDISCSLQEIN
jgi:muramoyltetrapeptide carboxypeptidase